MVNGVHVGLPYMRHRFHRSSLLLGYASLGRAAGLEAACGEVFSLPGFYYIGSNYQGQLGNGHRGKGLIEYDPVEVACPSPCTRMPSWAMVSTGDSHTCAISDAGALYCWGQSESRLLESLNQCRADITWDRSEVSGPFYGDAMQTLMLCLASGALGDRNPTPSQ